MSGTAERASGLVAAAAENMAAWHTTCLAALGVASARDAVFWSSPGPAPYIYLSGITLGGPQHSPEHARRAAALARSRPGPMGIADTWSMLDMVPAFGPEHRSWYAREPAAPALVLPQHVDIERIERPTELAAFERAQHRGFDTPDLAALGEFAVYGPRLLDDSRMHVIALRDPSGAIVSSAMAFVAAGVTGIYAVATPPEFRRRGYGEAVTRAALGVAPALPAVLVPSAMGEPIYRRMGFAPVGDYVNWIRTGR